MANSSISRPSFSSAAIHLGFMPRPAHVSFALLGLRYFGSTLRPARAWVRALAAFGGLPRLPLPPVRDDSLASWISMSLRWDFACLAMMLSMLSRNLNSESKESPVRLGSFISHLFV